MQPIAPTTPAIESTVDGKAKSPLILWHLLSLDAPAVATLWTWFIAHVNHVPLHTSSLIAMAAAVWTLYAADRLLDAQSPGNDGLLKPGTTSIRAPPSLHGRDRDSRRSYWPFFCRAFPKQAIRLYLILGGLVFGYFVIIHATRSAHRLPKEIAVGVCFAAATFIPTVAREPSLTAPAPGSCASAGRALQPQLPLHLCVGASASLGRDAAPGDGSRAATSTRARITIAAVSRGRCALAVPSRAPWPLYAAVTLSTLALLFLHLRRATASALESASRSRPRAPHPSC